MIIGELINDFNTFRSGCDTIKIVTNDSDFGCLIDLDLVTVETMLDSPSLTELRIKRVLNWWIEYTILKKYGAPNFDVEACLVIQI